MGKDQRASEREAKYLAVIAANAKSRGELSADNMTKLEFMTAMALQGFAANSVFTQSQIERQSRGQPVIPLGDVAVNAARSALKALERDASPYKDEPNIEIVPS